MSEVKRSATWSLDPASVPRSLDVDPERGTELELLALLEDFELGERLGAGTMGAVWSARDRKLDRKVAIKLLRPGRHGRRASQRMFREARALARLVHPNVVAVHEVGRIADGSGPGRTPVYIVLEHVEGMTLAEWIRCGRRPWPEVVALLSGVAKGLAAAHAAELIHRDVKPANILIDSHSGAAKLADFGLARGGDELDEPLAADAGEQPAQAVRLTRIGKMIGTPAYMAPEQLRGLDASPASDQFAFCLCLWEALHQDKPWPCHDLQTLVQAALDGKLVPGRGLAPIPRWLDRLLRRGLALEPAARFPSMEALLHQLEEGPKRGPRRRRAAGFALAAVGVAMLSSWWTQLEDTREFEANYEQACVAPLRLLEGRWNPQRRAALEQSFAELGGEAGGTRARYIGELLDARVSTWLEEYGAQCERTTDGRPAEPLVAACLDERSASLEATLEVLLQPSEATLEHATDIIHDTIAFGPCADSSSLSTLPSSLEGRATYIELRSELARIEALRDEAPPARVEAFAARVEAFAHAPLRASVELIHARQEELAGREDEQEAALIRAYEAAAGVADDALTLEVLGQLIAFLARQRRFVEADWLVRHGDLVLARCGAAHPKAAAGWDNRKAIMAFHRGDYASAAALFERAWDTYSALPSGELLGLPSLGNLATVVRRQGRFDEARARYERVVELELDIYGAEDTRLFGPYIGLALLEIERDTARARAWIERGELLMRGREPAAEALAQVNWAHILLNAGDYGGALEHSERARELYASIDKRGEQAWISAELLAATALLHRGELDEAAARVASCRALALELYAGELPRAEAFGMIEAELALARGQLDAAEQALLKVREGIGPGMLEGLARNGRLELGFARLALARGDRQAALAQAQRGHGLSHDFSANANLARPTLALLSARLLVETGGDADEARALAERAREQLREAEPSEGREALAAELDAWLAAQAR